MIYSDPEFDGWDDQKVIAAGGWGEARSLGSAGIQASINTAQNRVKSGLTWWGHDLRSAFLAHNSAGVWQYDCFMVSDPNRAAILKESAADPLFQTALDLAGQALAGTLEDLTSGADSYFDHRIPIHPDWSFGRAPCFILLPHWYFRTIAA